MRLLRPVNVSKTTVCDTSAIIHRAIGWLIDRGMPPEDAAGELRRRAAATGRTLSVAAQHLLEMGIAGTIRIRRPDPRRSVALVLDRMRKILL